MSKNRLAILISGSFRNFDEVWPANESLLDKLEIEYDVFFHTWKKNPPLGIDILGSIYNNKFYLSFFSKKFNPFLQSIDEEMISSKYNFESIQVEDFDEDSISVDFNLGTPESNNLFRSQLNSCGMYLGIDAVFKQLKSKNSHTHFLRLRPDFMLEADSLQEIFKNDLVFFGQLLPTSEGPIGDQCYGGPLSKSAFILETLSQLKSITAVEDWNKPQPSVLAENVIRLQLAPFRSSLKILYLDGCGGIARPSLVLADKPLSFNGLQIIIKHNLFTLKNKVKRLLE